MNDLRKATEQALAFTLRDFATVRDFEAARSVLHDTLQTALAQFEQQLTLTFDAFVKQIRDKALYETIYEDTEGREILVITLLHAYVLMRRTALPQRKPLTSGELYTAYITATNQTLRPQDERLAFAFARAIEKAHGIGGEHE